MKNVLILLILILFTGCYSPLESEDSDNARIITTTGQLSDVKATSRSDYEITADITSDCVVSVYLGCKYRYSSSDELSWINSGFRIKDGNIIIDKDMVQPTVDAYFSSYRAYDYKIVIVYAN